MAYNSWRLLREWAWDVELPSDLGGRDYGADPPALHKPLVWMRTNTMQLHGVTKQIDDKKKVIKED